MTTVATFQEGGGELEVTFRPPLFLQRRGWVFDILRREGISQVLDVGCGEGSIISCLCNPAPWLPPPRRSILETFAKPLPPSNVEDATTMPSAPTTDTLQLYLKHAPETFLSPTRIIGLDISTSDLEIAIADTAPSDWRTRWQPLEVEIWQGGLEVVNSALAGIDCIVATEVIEHLPEHILEQFAPVLLGAYQPRLLLITTPSYTFNARFTAPDAPRSARSGYPDPTQKTDRIFRHHDHKFEWTPQEFTTWCVAQAEAWGYDVEVGGVGRAAEKDMWGRDEALGYATQVAAFKRRDDEDWDERRRTLWEQKREALGSREGQHKLLAVHRHVAHEKASQPLSISERGDVVKRTLTDLRSSTMTLGDLWWEERVAAACGGWMELLAAAVAHHEEIDLDMTSSSMSEWTAKLKILLPEDDSPLDPEEGETYDMEVGSPCMSDSDEPITPPTSENTQPEGDQSWSKHGHTGPFSLSPLGGSDDGGAWGNDDNESQGWDTGAEWGDAWTCPLETGASGW